MERFSLQLVQFAVSVVLARLLLPEQFGLIGMLALFIAVAQTLLDSGFGNALIQKKDTDHVDQCSVFYFNLAIGVVLAILFFLGAPLIAAFYQEPLLTPLTRFFALSIVINAFGLIQLTLLTKQLDFKAQLKANLYATILSGIAYSR